jgi:hypothetical protein
LVKQPRRNFIYIEANPALAFWLSGQHGTANIASSSSGTGFGGASQMSLDGLQADPRRSVAVIQRRATHQYQSMVA